MVSSRLHKSTIVVLIICLTALSLLYVVFTPDKWWFSNDDALYLGSAENLLRTGRYEFNELPNLQYYPGTSALLALALLAFGKNFHILHLIFIAIAVASFWMTFAAFRETGGPLLTLVVALLLGLNDVYMSYVYYLRSECLFLLLVLAAIYAWQRFTCDGHSMWLYTAVIVTALAPMVRFEGLILCLALTLALVWSGYRQRRPWLLRTILISALIVTPFALWTLRNFLLYTPDAYNMALNFFFGLAGPALYSHNFHVVELDSDWMYPVVRLATLVTRLVNSVVELGIRGTGAVPLVLGSGFLFCFVMGLRPWYLRASLLERCFFGLLFAFLIHHTADMNNTTTLVVHARYYLVLLPFLILISGMGLRRFLFDLASRRRSRSTSAERSQTIGLAVLMLVLSICGYFGLARLTQYGSQHWSNYWNERHMALDQVRQYAAENIPPGTVIAGTDFGMVPYMTGRKAITIIDSPLHSLRRMADNDARYFVIFISTQAGIRPHRQFDEKTLLEVHPYYQTATGLVRDYPQVFERVLDPIPSSKRNLVAIYKIQHDELQRILN